MCKAKKTILALVLALTALCGCSAGTAGEAMLIEDPEAKGTANYRTSTAQMGDLIKTSQLSLECIYYLSQDLTVREDGLYFGSFLVERGQTVKEGEPIAVFTRQGSQAQVESCRLAIDRAQEEYDYESTRIQAEIAAQSTGSETGRLQRQLLELELEELEYYRQLEQEQLEADLEAAEAAFEDEYLYAPYDCVISSLASFDAGASLKVGTVLAEIKQADSLVLYSASTAKNFLYNMDVQVEYGRKDSRDTVAARVVSNDAVLPGGVMGSGYTYFKLQEPMSEDELVKPTASVTTVQAQQALLVPRSAVQVEDGHYYVSVLDGDMVKKRHIIRGITGGTVGETCVVVLAGLEPGQTVILG